MSKVYMAQVAFVALMVIAVIALGVEIFIGHMNPDVIIPWAYAAGAGLLGSTVCLAIRLYAKYRASEKHSNR